MPEINGVGLSTEMYFIPLEIEIWLVAVTSLNETVEYSHVADRAGKF